MGVIDEGGGGGGGIVYEVTVPSSSSFQPRSGGSDFRPARGNVNMSQRSGGISLRIYSEIKIKNRITEIDVEQKKKDMREERTQIFGA